MTVTKKVDPFVHFGPTGKALCGVVGHAILGVIVRIVPELSHVTCPSCREIGELMVAIEGRMG